jgi:hypothetical protein
MKGPGMLPWTNEDLRQISETDISPHGENAIFSDRALAPERGSIL